MARALDSIRVIDFGQYIAGPLAAMLLADNGAEVIRVDPPGGPRWHHKANAILQRGKRSIVLDLKDAADQATARRLVESADVVIENFRPGVIDRLGLGPAAMLAANPGLVYTSLPGFAADDPRAGLQAWEGVVAAAAGIYYPGRLTDLERGPIFTAVPIASSFAAIIASHCIVAALIARDRGAAGQRVEVALFDAALEALGNQAQVIGDKINSDQGVHTQDPRVPMNNAVGGRHQCADGRWVDISPPHRGMAWFAEHFVPKEDGEGGVTTVFNTDPAAVARFKTLMDGAFRSKPAAEWERVANAEAGTGLAYCQTTQEWLHDEHARASGCVIPLNDPALGAGWQAGYPVQLSKTPMEAAEPRHAVDGDREAILAELGAAKPAAEAPRGGVSRALEGMRVVDLTQVLAGPSCARILAEYGADVVKINNPRPDRNPFGSNSHTYVNNGKRTMLLDLKTPEGLDILGRLVERADVFHQNFIVGAAERMGFSEDDVRKRKPEIIYSTVNTHAYGGFRGVWRGHEELGQAVTGMQTRFGGDEAPARSGWALCDYSTGHFSALAVLLALFHRMRTGEGQHVRAALSASATFLQVPFMLDFAGQIWDEPRGLKMKGWGPLNRLYKGSDRWFYLAAKDFEAIRSVNGLEEIASVPPIDREALLEAAFATESADLWVVRLAAAGVGAHGALDIIEVMFDERVMARGLSVSRQHPGIGEIRNVGVPRRLSGTPLVSLEAAPSLGTHTRDVLDELGLGGRYDELVEKGAVAGPDATSRLVKSSS